MSGSSVGAIPALTLQAVMSPSLQPPPASFLSSIHPSFIHSADNYLLSICLCRCRKQNRLTSKQVSSTDSQSVGSMFVQALLCPLFQQSILQVILCLEQGKKKKKLCQEFISVHLCVAVYTHIIFNICSSVVMGTIFWCLWA